MKDEAQKLFDCTGFAAGSVTVSQARSLAVDTARRLDRTEELDLSKARHRVLAAQIRAGHDVPPFANAAMDGFALMRSDLLRAAGPGLPLGRDIRAGDRPVQMIPRTAHRITTGSVMPAGAEIVIPQEHAHVLRNRLILTEIYRGKNNIRHAGEDIAEGAPLADAGDIATSRRLALAAASGVTQVRVVAPLRVALVSTGNEIVAPDLPLAPGQIHDSVRVFLSAELDRPGLEILDFGAHRDDPMVLAEVIGRAASAADIVLTTGGASVGKADSVKGALSFVGARQVFHGVRMRPGKPLGLYQLSDAQVFTLPGNPFAAAVGFLFFVRDAIEAAIGGPLFQRETVRSQLSCALENRHANTEFVPVSLTASSGGGAPVAKPCGRGSSSRLSPLAAADGIAILPAGISRIDTQDCVDVLALRG